MGGRMLALWACLALAACDSGRKLAEAPPPQASSRDHVGYYCNMIVVDHAGPKGQIHLRGGEPAHWFTSARDTLAFLMLPDEPKDVAAAYVTDMGRGDWDHPEAGTGVWIDARTAWYVIDSEKRGGMGQRETVPFADRPVAEAFAREHGGQVVGHADVPPDYVLGSD
jgi:copper chaperone NosL